MLRYTALWETNSAFLARVTVLDIGIAAFLSRPSLVSDSHGWAAG